MVEKRMGKTTSGVVCFKEMALIGEPIKAARWGPIGVPILVFCYSIG